MALDCEIPRHLLGASLVLSPEHGSERRLPRPGPGTRARWPASHAASWFPGEPELPDALSDKRVIFFRFCFLAKTDHLDLQAHTSDDRSILVLKILKA